MTLACSNHAPKRASQYKQVTNHAREMVQKGSLPLRMKQKDLVLAKPRRGKSGWEVYLDHDWQGISGGRGDGIVQLVRQLQNSKVS